MKHFKRVLPLVLALVLLCSTVLAPCAQAASMGKTTSGAIKLEGMQPFNGTDALILSAIAELQEQGKTLQIAEPDAALVQRVEKATGESYEAVKTGLFTDLKADLMQGSVDVSALGLNRNDMAAVMAEVLQENYLYNAVTELSYTVKDGKVQNVGFRVSEGFASAMTALDAEFGEKLNVTVSKDQLATLVALSESGLHVGGDAFVHEGEEGEDEGAESSCRSHTVGTSVMLADLNEDGTLNVKDIALFRQMNVEGTYSEVADANGDGELNVKDIAVIRQMNVSGEYQYLAGGSVEFHWEQVVNMQPDPQLSQNEKGEFLDSNGQVVVDETGAPVQTPYVFDAQGNPTGLNPQIAVLNGGLIYNPETGEILQGLLPEVDWNLAKISLHCSVCGQDVEITDPEVLAQSQMKQEAYIHFLSADQSQYEIVTFNDNEKPPLAPVMQTDENGNPVIGEDGKPVYVQEVDENGDPVVDADGKPVYVMAEDPSYLHYSEMQIGTYFDDTAVFIDTDGDEIPDTPMPEFAVDAEGNPIVDENGQPVPAVDEQGNVIIPGMFTEAQDNGAIEVAWYYGQLSAFNADHAEYYGVSADYWTSKNSEQNPMAAVKSLCNLDPNMDLPPMQMLQLVQMLPQAFMAYVHFYGNELLAMRDAAMAVVNKLPRNATDVQVMLALHDWLAENAVFDMGSMVSVNSSGGSPETDPIQMTTFGAILSNQLTTMTNSGYYGCICLGYAAAYNYLVQCAFPNYYKDETGNWLTPDEIGSNDLVDFGQVMFYANTAETSIAGEGFGGGMFNNVHYYNMVRLPKAPTTANQGIVLDADEEDEMVGNWFFVDACYDDIYVECLSQYRAEADGSLYHSYFLVSPQTMIKLWSDSVDYIDNLYDGWTYQVKTDANGNPVYFEEGDSRYDPEDPQHPQYEKVENPNEQYNHNTCYEDSWFAGATSKIYYDDYNWYYVDACSSSTAYSDMMDENGDINFDQMPEDWDQNSIIHSTRVDVEEQGKIKTRPVDAPDWWPEEEDEDDSNNGGFGMDFNMSLNTKEDPYASVLFDYGTGLFTGIDSIDLSAAVEEDFIYRDQFPGLNRCLGLYKGVLYFNLGNQIYGFNVTEKTCTLIKEYNTVSANSDGRPFTASSYTLAADGTALTVENNPIAGLVVRTAYKPLYNYVDANGKVVMDYMGQFQNGYTDMSAAVGQVFQMMATQDTMTVNIGTNYSFTSAFADGMSDDEKAASRYTVEAINLNPDYNLGMDSGEDVNSNEEFLWCANIREDIPMADLTVTAPGEDKVPCTAQIDGHEYEYDAEEKVYICKHCDLWANNIVKAEEGITVTMEALAESGISEDSFSGMEGMEGLEGMGDPVVPASAAREAAVKTYGEILITVEVEEGLEKRVRGISYIAAGAAEGTEPTEVTTTNEAGQFVLNKEDVGCIEITVLLDDTYTITAPEHILIEDEKVDAIEGEEIKFTVEEGYRAEDVTITYEVPVEPTEPEATEPETTEPEVTDPETTDPAAPAADETEPSEPEATEPEATEPEVEYETKTVVLEADENGVYTFVMPASDVTITATIDKVYDITTSSDQIIVEDELEEAAEGETVTFTIEEGYQATDVKVTYEIPVEPTEPEETEPTEPEETEPTEPEETEPTEPEETEPAPEPAPVAEVTYETVEVELTFDPETGVYSFEMPAHDVTISATTEKLYNITISDSIVNGTVTSVEQAVAGEVVTLSMAPNAGYRLTKVLVEYVEDGITLSCSVTINNNSVTFAMPNADVTVSATFTALPTYNINLPTELVGGTVTANKTATFAGDTVTLTVTPAAGYALETLVVKDAEGNEITVTANTFTMPEGDVTVTATFVEVSYTVTVVNQVEGVTVTAGAESAKFGDVVTLNVTATDKTLKLELTYEGAAEPTILVADANGIYAFTMPAGNVTITVTEVEEEPETPAPDPTDPANP